MRAIVRDPRALLFHGDALDIARVLPENSVDALVEDPPYGLSFMGEAWDHDVPGVPFWTAAMRVMKPGAHGAVFGGTRMWHRQACAIEDAGFEIRDTLLWLYGSGMPKSVGEKTAIALAMRHSDDLMEGIEAAEALRGRGTGLKPSWEPIILFRKPLEGTIVENVNRYGTGALNIDGCRIGTDDTRGKVGGGRHEGYGFAEGVIAGSASGRWPANVVVDELAALLVDEQSGITKNSGGTRSTVNPMFMSNAAGAGHAAGKRANAGGLGDKGGASRFFYCAKAARKEKELGLEHLEAASAGEATNREDGTKGLGNPRAGAGRTGGAKNVHPTVKPIALMRWLTRLITPPGGVVLDRFGGSGSTAVAALEEGLSVITVEKGGEDDRYLPIIEGRIRAALARTSGNKRSEDGVEEP